MVQQGHIDHLLQESGEIHPPRNLVEQANLQDYDGVYQRSINDPEGFWGEVASELEWFSPWDKVMQWDYPDFKWFLNVIKSTTLQCLNCRFHASMPRYEYNNGVGGDILNLVEKGNAVHWSHGYIRKNNIEAVILNRSRASCPSKANSTSQPRGCTTTFRMSWSSFWSSTIRTDDMCYRIIIGLKDESRNLIFTGTTGFLGLSSGNIGHIENRQEHSHNNSTDDKPEETDEDWFHQ